MVEGSFRDATAYIEARRLSEEGSRIGRLDIYGSVSDESIGVLRNIRGVSSVERLGYVCVIFVDGRRTETFNLV